MTLNRHRFVTRGELPAVRHTRWRAGGSCLVALSLLTASCGGDSGELAELKGQVAALEEKLDHATSTAAPLTTTTAPPTTTTQAQITTTAPPTTTKAAVRVTTSDIAIDYIVLDESCFGSAGSSMEIEMLPALRAGSSLSVDEFANLRLLVTFDIVNTEDGVTRGSFEIDRGMFNAKTDYLNFKRCNTLPNIVVTEVRVRTTESASSTMTTTIPTATTEAPITAGISSEADLAIRLAVETLIGEIESFSSGGSGAPPPDGQRQVLNIYRDALGFIEAERDTVDRTDLLDTVAHDLELLSGEWTRLVVLYAMVEARGSGSLRGHNGFVSLGQFGPTAGIAVRNQFDQLLNEISSPRE